MTDLDRLLAALVAGETDTGRLAAQLDMTKSAISGAVWSLRALDLVEFDTMKPTPEGRAKAARLADVPAIARPATDPDPVPLDTVAEVDEEGAARIVARPSMANFPGGQLDRRASQTPPMPPLVRASELPRPAPKQRPLDPPPPGFTRTRSPAAVIRRIGLEVDLQDPRRFTLAMAKEWPEASRRLIALARRREQHFHALVMDALSRGIEAIEQEG